MTGLIGEPLILCLIFLGVAWLASLTFLFLRIWQTFSRLSPGKDNKDIKTLLDEILREVENSKNFDAGIVKELTGLKASEEESLKKVGLVRYNPFADTGGNQSFVLALLNSKNNGLVITSLHSREATRVFAKPVIQGKETGYEFSKEEVAAIQSAQKS